MVHVVSSLRPAIQPLPVIHKPVRPITTTGGSSTGTEVADFQALFAPKVTSTAVNGSYNPFNASTSTPAPTAESVFGPNPWLSNPTGVGPNGATYSYNNYYFASPDTAQKVAQMVGGTVVKSNQFTGNGGAFAQQQPNLMVQLPNGHLINPGLVASFYTHGYPQSYIDQMVANEVQNG